MINVKITFFKSTLFKVSALPITVSVTKSYQLRRCGRGQPINEQPASALELSHLDNVQVVVNSNGVTAVSVAAFVYESAKGRCLVIRQGQEG